MSSVLIALKHREELGVVLALHLRELLRQLCVVQRLVTARQSNEALRRIVTLLWRLQLHHVGRARRLLARLKLAGELAHDMPLSSLRRAQQRFGKRCFDDVRWRT